MKVTKSEQGAATIRFTDEELYILNNALNEVCNGLDVQDFSTRMGAEREEASDLLAQINQLLKVKEM